MASDSYTKFVRQNEVIISLLGRIAFTEDQVRELIVKNKRHNLRDKYILGYNSCDGTKTVSQVADIIGIANPTLSPIIQEWEEWGIIYEVQKKGGKYYRKIFPV